jgi:alpha-D-ribose 1-methylphosphonate 5-triphosphate synthase subunit PhnH
MMLNNSLPLTAPQAPKSHRVSAAVDASVFDSQSTFRSIMSAFAEPGTLHTLNTHAQANALAGLCSAATAVALTLLDHDTGVWFDPNYPDSVASSVQFKTGSRIVARPEYATFAFISDPASLPRLGKFSLGTLQYPDTSTTVVVTTSNLLPDGHWRLTGPGIQSVRRFGISPEPEWLLQDLADNRGLFPRGVDLIFCAGADIAALPRSTQISDTREASCT